MVSVELCMNVEGRGREGKPRCHPPPPFQREAPYFCKHFCPFWHPNLATALFLASFVQLKLHVILRKFHIFVWILLIFWPLMLTSRGETLQDVLLFLPWLHCIAMWWDVLKKYLKEYHYLFYEVLNYFITLIFLP